MAWKERHPEAASAIAPWLRRGADALSLSRVAAAGAFGVWAAFADRPASPEIGGSFALVAATDAVDGPIARLAGRLGGKKSVNGGWYDQCADKFWLMEAV